MNELRIAPIPDTNYYARYDGAIFNERTGRQLKPQDNGRGRLIATLYSTDGHVTRTVSSLVLEAFVPDGKHTFAPGVNRVARHRDGDYRNCRLSNLCWDTRDGVEWRTRVPPMMDRPVMAISHEEHRVFSNSIEAGIFYDLSDAQIEMLCMDPNEYISYGGCTWRWV